MYKKINVDNKRKKEELLASKFNVYNSSLIGGYSSSNRNISYNYYLE